MIQKVDKPIIEKSKEYLSEIEKGCKSLYARLVYLNETKTNKL